MLKVNNSDFRKKCEICSKLTLIYQNDVLLLLGTGNCLQGSCWSASQSKIIKYVVNACVYYLIKFAKTIVDIFSIIYQKKGKIK